MHVQLYALNVFHTDVFNDPLVRPTLLSHYGTLYMAGPDENDEPRQDGDEGVMHEALYATKSHEEPAASIDGKAMPTGDRSFLWLLTVVSSIGGALFG